MDILNSLKDFIDNIGEAVVLFLPQSPFTGVVSSLRGSKFLPYLNWVVPVGQILTILNLWLVAIIFYYLVMALLRAVHIIGS